jgi:hypothetical protein
VLDEWASAVTDVLSEAEPTFPDEHSDRQWDLWEPLFAIADLTSWSSDARTVAVALHARAYNDTSAGLLAVEHSRAMFNGHEAMSTKSILEEFVAREDGPWAPWWGHDVEAGH